MIYKKIAPKGVQGYINYLNQHRNITFLHGRKVKAVRKLYAVNVNAWEERRNVLLAKIAGYWIL